MKNRFTLEQMVEGEREGQRQRRWLNMLTGPNLEIYR
jgi:hypothetical protein